MLPEKASFNARSTEPGNTRRAVPSCRFSREQMGKGAVFKSMVKAIAKMIVLGRCNISLTNKWEWHLRASVIRLAVGRYVCLALALFFGC